MDFVSYQGITLTFIDSVFAYLKFICCTLLFDDLKSSQLKKIFSDFHTKQ